MQSMSQVSATAGSSASLRQRRRADRQAPQRFELELPGIGQSSGVRADAGVAMLSGAAGGIGVALKRMADYEPQALRLLADGSLAIDLADDAIWLGARQGAFAEYRVAALAAGTNGPSATSALWPALNAPLLLLAAPHGLRLRAQPTTFRSAPAAVARGLRHGAAASLARTIELPT